MNKASPLVNTPQIPSALQECIDEALLDGPRLIQQWLQSIAGTLLHQQQKASSPKEMQGWRQAHETLQMVRVAVQSFWVKHWHQSMNSALHHTGTPTNTHLGTLRFEALELMNQDQVNATVEAARFEQSVLLTTRSAFESWIGRLDHIVAPAQRLTLATNPLRPETAVQSLVHTLETVCPDDKIRARWLQIGGPVWGELLAQLYGLLDRVLDHHGPLLSDDFETPTTRSDKTAAKTPVETQITLSELHQLLVNDWSKQTTASTLPLAFVESPVRKQTQPQDWQETTIGADSSSADRRRRARDGADALADISTAHLTDLAEEVVGLMLDSMTNDPRLLPPVVEGLQQLRPALLQAAREEPRFFSDRNNPARQLLDELTLRSLAYSKSTAPEFQAYFRQIKQTLVILNSAKELSASARFTQALSALTNAGDSKKSDKSQDQSDIVATLLRAEQRYLLTDKIRQQLSARSDMKTATPELLSFIYGPWAQVIAEAHLSSQSGAAAEGTQERYVQLLPDLIWSCNPVSASRNIPRLVKTIPLLLRHLREGLQRIHFSPEETTRFLQHVMGQHEKAIKNPKNIQQRPPVEERTLPSPTPSSHLSQPTAVPKTDWQSTMPFGGADFASTELMSAPASYAEDADETSLLPHLTLGAWVEINHPEGTSHRAQLNWISPHGTMYLFKTGDGQTISLSKPMCQQLFRQQGLRVVAMNSMVDDALDTVMAQAVRNSAIWP